MSRPNQRVARVMRIHTSTTLTTLFLSLLSLSLFFISLVDCVNVYTDREYAFRVDPISSLPTSVTGWSRSTTTDVDDAPFEKRSFNFSFPFWNLNFQEVGIDPNGALHLPTPTFLAECCDTQGRQCAFNSQACTLTTAYFDLIAMALTDLDPSATATRSTSGVEYSLQSDAFYVRYRNISLYTLTTYNATLNGVIPTMTFSAELRKTGVIRVRYDSIADPRNYSGWSIPDLTRLWVVGLKQSNPLVAPSLASVQTLNRGDWDTLANGTFPPRAQIVSGRQVTYWPFGSAACNSPSIGALGYSWTYVYLNTFRGNLADFQLECVFNENSDPDFKPAVRALYNDSINALLCHTPPTQVPGTVLRLNLREVGSTEFLPITPLTFTYFDVSSPEWLRYRNLTSRSGSHPSQGDLTVCYECARMLPTKCLGGGGFDGAGVCNTPQVGRRDGSTSTVVLAPNYAFETRIKSGLVSQVWCVWSNATGTSNNPNGLNPWLNPVAWTPASLYTNASWIVCTPPSGVYPIGQRLNLSIAENNFVFAGGVGPAGGGIGSIGNLESQVNEEQRDARHITMAMTIVDETDVRLQNYEAYDYFKDFLFNVATNLNASSPLVTSSAAQIGRLNLNVLCDDCVARLTSALQATPISGPPLASTSGYCIDSNSTDIELCISPQIADERGGAIAGDNATIYLFTRGYDILQRWKLFNLSCVMSNYYTINTSSLVNVTVEESMVETTYVTSMNCTRDPVGGSETCVEVTSQVNKTVTVTRIQQRMTYTPTYVPVNHFFIPMVYDSSQHLFSCLTPPSTFFPWMTLQTTFSNLTLGKVLVSIGENNRLLTVSNMIRFEYVTSTDWRMIDYGSSRLTQPPRPPWSSCFTCDPLFRTSIGQPKFSTLPDGSTRCFVSANAPGLMYLSICNSPPISARTQMNSTIQVFTHANYPIATRASLTQVYCRFTNVPQYVYQFNSTTNQTNLVLLDVNVTYAYQPVLTYDLTNGFVVCSPPPYSMFQTRNLSVTITEYLDPIPFSPFIHTYVDEDDSRLIFYRSKGGQTPTTFSSQQFCTDCHETNVGNVPNFTAYSPTGQAGLCYIDCSNEWNGLATYDDCGVCTQGTTGLSYNSNLDCLGICFGPFASTNYTRACTNFTFVSTTNTTSCTNVGSILTPDSYCRCEDRDACFNITSQPLVGVSATVTIAGRPQTSQSTEGDVTNRQYLLRSFALPRQNVSGQIRSAYDLTRTRWEETLTPDPSFDSNNGDGWTRVPETTWFQTSATSTSTVDPFTLSLGGWTFPFFESTYSTIYVSSSGAILFTRPSDYVTGCLGIPIGTDPRIPNLGLLQTLFANPNFTNNCATNLILPYMTYLDPSGNFTQLPGAEDPLKVAAYVAAGMPTNRSASISYLIGDTNTDTRVPTDLKTGKFVSIKFENVPYNYVAFNPYKAGAAPATRVTKPANATVTPLYSFQITLYQTGRISLKLYNVTDPLLAGFNTSRTLSNLVVGLIDRPMPLSVLTQSSPNAAYVDQMSRQAGRTFDVQGAIAIQRQRQWIAPSNVPIGVFPPRDIVQSGSQHIFCPFAINACAYPTAGPPTGGTLITISLRNLTIDSVCIRRLLSLKCVFGDISFSTPALFDSVSGTLQCLSPSGPNRETVPLYLMEGEETLITTNRLFWSWVPFGHERLVVREYDPNTNTTRMTHITGHGDTDPANAVTAQGYRQALCESCSSFNPDYCPLDCFGTFFGLAFHDDCGNCTGGLTGRLPNFSKDCSGVCFGRSSFLTTSFVQQDGSINNLTQCACTPTTHPSCQVSALTKMSPTATLSKQYVYTTLPNLTGSSKVGWILPDPIWEDFPSSAIILTTPFPEMTRITLPFPFQFFTQLLHYVYISPWGGVFMEELSSTCLERGVDGMFETDGSSTCPYQLIAPNVMRWTNRTDIDSKIIYYPSEDGSMFTIVWSNMYPSNSSQPPSTFQVNLFEGGHVRISYKDIRDPNPFVFETNEDDTSTSTGLLTQSSYDHPPSPSYVRIAPYWLIGITQSWYTSTGVYETTLSNTSNILQREVVVPFPYLQITTTNKYVSTKEQKRYLNFTNSPLGTFPNRLKIESSSQYQYCLIDIQFCMTPYWGPYEGGNLLRIFSKDWGCLKMVPNSTIETSTNCCVASLELQCIFGQTIVTKATFNQTTMSAECEVPQGIPGTTVTVYLAESGRRIGPQNMVYAYNTSRAAMAASAIFTYYANDSFACESCASTLSTLITSDAGLFCSRDCYGSFRGSGYLDTCGICSGGRTGHVAESDRDCRGTCFGPFTMESVDGGDPQCLCNRGTPATGQQSVCDYYSAKDGPVQLSKTMKMRQYLYMLIALAVGGFVLVLAQLAFGLRGISAVFDEILGIDRVNGGDVDALNAAAALGLAPPAGAAAAGAPLLAAGGAAAPSRRRRANDDALMGAAGGLERRAERRARRARRQQEREQRAAAAAAAANAPAPALSAAAAAALEMAEE